MISKSSATPLGFVVALLSILLFLLTLFGSDVAGHAPVRPHVCQCKQFNFNKQFVMGY